MSLLVVFKGVILHRNHAAISCQFQQHVWCFSIAGNLSNAQRKRRIKLKQLFAQFAEALNVSLLHTQRNNALSPSRPTRFEN